MVNRIIGVIGWIGTALVFGSVAVRMIRPEWNQYGTWAAWAGLVCVLIYLGGQWRDVKTFYSGRQARYGTMSIVALLVGLGIVVAINYLGVRQNKRWDFTANQVHSLSEQTIKILRGLDAPVKITVYDKDTEFDRFRDRLEEYAYHSHRFTAEYVDADKNPARAKAAEVTNYGTLVIEYKDKVERISSIEEQDITNALIKATTGEQRKVYFMQGHGEKDTAGSDRLGYSAVASALSRDNYGVEKLILAQQRDVPADASAVIVAGPSTDLLQPEIDALKRYVAKGGKVMFMIDPPTGPDASPLPNILAFLKEWGMNVGTDVVVDASGIGQLLGTDASVPVAAPPYPPHAITDRFGVMTAFPLARSVRPVEGGVAGRSAQAFVQTSPQSWAETDLKALAGGGQVSFDADKGDTQGPVPLAAAVSAPATEAPTPLPTNSSPNEPAKPESRVVAFGDSDFASNSAAGIQGNRDLFLNAVSWLAQSENLIAIRPRETEDRRITLTSDQHQRIMLLSLLIVPGLIMAAGGYVWWRRR